MRRVGPPVPAGRRVAGVERGIRVGADHDLPAVRDDAVRLRRPGELLDLPRLAVHPGHHADTEVGAEVDVAVRTLPDRVDGGRAARDVGGDVIAGAVGEVVPPDSAVVADADHGRAGKLRRAQLHQFQCGGAAELAGQRAVLHADRGPLPGGDVVAVQPATLDVVELAVERAVRPQAHVRAERVGAAPLARGEVVDGDVVRPGRAVPDQHEIAMAHDPVDEVGALRVGRQRQLGHRAAGRVDGHQVRGRAGTHPELVVHLREAPGVVPVGDHAAVVADLAGHRVVGVHLRVRVGGAVEGLAVHDERAQHLLADQAGGQLGQRLALRLVAPEAAVVGGAHAEVDGVVVGDHDGAGHCVRRQLDGVQQTAGPQVDHVEADRSPVRELVRHRSAVGQDVSGREPHVRGEHGGAEILDRARGCGGAGGSQRRRGHDAGEERADQSSGAYARAHAGCR